MSKSQTAFCSKPGNTYGGAIIFINNNVTMNITGNGNSYTSGGIVNSPFAIDASANGKDSIYD